MSEEIKVPLIYAKIAEVQKVVKTVGKDAEVGYGNNKYKAVTHDKVLSVIREHCINNGILIIPDQLEKGVSVPGKTKSGGDKIRFEAVYCVRFVSVEDGSELSMNVEGHGEDSNDKGAGKAITYATKSAMLKMFLLATGENDEARIDNGDDNSAYYKQQSLITENQVANIDALIADVGADETKFCDHLKVRTIADIPADRYEYAVKALEGKRGSA